MTTITCKIPESLNARLEAAARERRMSKSRLVRDAIDQNFTAPPRRRARAYDVVKGLCGKLRGPADLSSNPKHLEHFGA